MLVRCRLYVVDCSYFITTTYNVQSEDSFQRVNGSFNVNHMEFNMLVPEQKKLDRKRTSKR